DPPAQRIRRGINRIQDLPVDESVEFNKFRQAVGKWQFLFGKYVGTRTRRLISILKKNWKDVRKEEKNFLWSDIKAHFRLENDDVKKHTLLSCGPKGYRSFEKQWEGERNDPDKATELYLIPDLRSSNYCLARAPCDKFGIKPLPAKLIDVSNKLVQAASELSQSSNEPKSRVDPLIMVLGPEHGGRTRGVGCDIGYKKGVEGYVKKKRTSEQRKDNEEIRNEMRQQVKEELKSSDFWLEMRAELKVKLRNEIIAEHNLSPREDDVPSSVELKSSLNSTTNMVRNESQGQQNESFSPRQDHRRLNLSSTKSIVREEQQGEQNESSSTKPVDVLTSVFKIQCVKEETYGCLYVPSFALAGQQVICATATIYPVLGDGMIHFQKLRKGHMKVAVLKVMEKHKNMELPVPDDELAYLEPAVNDFIQWPIFAIGRYKGTSKPPVTDVPPKCLMPQHEREPSSKKGKVNDTPKEPNKKDKASEDTTNKQKSIQRVEKEKAANQKRLQDLENDILTKPQSVIDGYNRWMSRADIDLCFHEKFATMDYLAQSLTCYEFYLAPFLQGRHYVLLIICLKDGRGVILNPQKDSQMNENCYRLAGLVDSFGGSMKWDFPLVNRQPKDWECGYYIMKWMHDFVLKYQHDNFPNTPAFI
nr:ulp1 protease family, C-terminal catalytic domain-containing protein [Tanacetum cinerariifolium]